MISVLKAVELLLNKEVVILPSDTLYGFAALAYDDMAIKKIFHLKKRDFRKQLPVHYSSIEQVFNDCVISEKALSLMNKFWPGALTIVLPKKSSSQLACVNYSVAVRIPNCSIVLEIIKKINQPLVLPSANLSNSENVYQFHHIQEMFPNIPGVYGDEFLCKAPSTIVSCVNDEVEILRQGAVIV